MLTRRDILLASVAAGVAMNTKTAFAKAAQPATPVNFEVPAGACDCHTHIHPDPAKFPFFAGRVYTPELASPEEMSALHKALQHGARGDRDAEHLRHRQFGFAVRHESARRHRPRRRRDRRQDAGERSRRHGQGGLSRRPAQSGDRRHQRSQCRPPALSGRGRAHESARLAHPDVHDPRDDLRDQGPGRDVAGDAGVRPFRRRAGRAGRGAARFCRPGRAGEIRQGLCQDLRRLSSVETGAGLSGRRPACARR